MARARRQHAAYEEALRVLGVTVVRAPAAPDLPDAVFIEDTAVVLEELAVMARPGAASRRAEPGPIAEVLSAYRKLRWIEPPGTLDGGDVLRVGRTLFVGLSSRTSPLGLEQLRDVVRPLGYTVTGVPVTGCLHLKSAVTEISDGVLLINPEWAPPPAFAGWELVPVDESEPAAANALRVGGSVVYPAQFMKTAARLRGQGVTVVPVECDELAKAEGGVTCCSLLVDLADRQSR